MRARLFGSQLFGYEKRAVDQKIRSLQMELDAASEKVLDLEGQLSLMEAQKDELTVTVAAMRRQQIQVTRAADSSEAVTVMVGPTDVLGVIAGLIDSLDGSPHLSVGFRMFRDGFYRVDGRAHDKDKLISWLRSQSAVRDVVVDQETLHVFPKGVSA